MADKFAFNGSFTTQPFIGSPSFAQSVVAPIDESISVKNWKRVRVELTTDSPVAVSFDQMLTACVLIMRVVEGGPKAKAAITTADGAAQVLPFEYHVTGSKTVPITAVSLTRVSGTATTVELFIAEQA